MVPLIIYIYQSDYLPSSSVVVLSQPSPVSVKHEVWVSLLASPPQTVFFSLVWRYLLSGRSGSWQCWPVEGTYTSAVWPTLLEELPVIIKPEYRILIILECPDLYCSSVCKEVRSRDWDNQEERHPGDKRHWDPTMGTLHLAITLERQHLNYRGQRIKTNIYISQIKKNIYINQISTAFWF